MSRSNVEAIDHLATLVSAAEIISPTSDQYLWKTSTWAAQKNKHPSLVIQPTSTESLSKVMAYLSTTDLDIGVRSSGYGSASARDVLISMSAFDEFEFDKDKEILTIGAGQPWRDYYEKMEKIAPEYQVVACRTPAIAVGGSILSGGLSWLAPQYGNTSDPANMLDAEVVKLDGKTVWASEEPDLLWALRGAGASFGVVTKFKLKAYRFTQSIFAGPIIIPRRQLSAVAKGVDRMNARPTVPQVSLDLAVLRKEAMAHVGATEDLLVVQAFDALGEEHGRSEEGFKWALEIPGAKAMTKVTNLRGVALMVDHYEPFKGRSKSFWSTPTINTLTEEIILNAVKWFDQVKEAPGSVAISPLLVFEILCTRDSTAGRTASAWPRSPGMRNAIIFSAGCSPDAPPVEEETARKLCIDAPTVLLGDKAAAEVHLSANALEDYHDLKKVYAENLPKLLELKKIYDPANKLKGPLGS